MHIHMCEQHEKPELRSRAKTKIYKPGRHLSNMIGWRKVGRFN